MTPRRRAGFTLIELLTVIAIIGILSAALFPAISGVRKKARQSAATTAFSQWAGGITRFKQVNGFYPVIGAAFPDSSKGDVLYQLEDPPTNLRFVKSLSGRSPTGSPLSNDDRKKLNRSAEEFCAFGKDDFEDTPGGITDASMLVDRFGNNCIRIIFDVDNNTNIRNISAPGGTESLPEEIRSISSTTGIPARVIIYTTDLLSDFGPTSDGQSSGDYAQVLAIQ